jgi:hypothetical protein
MPDDKPAIGGIAGAVLAYVDRPWKVAAVVVLAIVGVVGAAVYEQRDELVEAWLTPAAAELDTAAVPAALEKLDDESGADLVQIWAVDLSANSQRFVAARRRDGQRPVIPTPRRLPVIVTTSDLSALVSVLAGHPSCVDLEGRDSPIARRLADRGMVRGCAVPIPPSSEAFVGVIYLAWHTAPDTGTESVAVAAAREIAGKLVSR